MDEEIYDKLIKQFMADHGDLFREAKWCLLIDIIKNAKSDNDPAIVEAVLKFVQVFRKHDVDPDIVIEAFAVLSESRIPAKKEESNDISQSEFANFVNTLNKIRKKGEEGNASKMDT